MSNFTMFYLDFCCIVTIICMMWATFFGVKWLYKTIKKGIKK